MKLFHRSAHRIPEIDLELVFSRRRVVLRFPSRASAFRCEKLAEEIGGSSIRRPPRPSPPPKSIHQNQSGRWLPAADHRLHRPAVGRLSL